MLDVGFLDKVCGNNLWQRFCLNYTIVSVYEFRNDLCKSHTLGLRMAGNIACAGLNVFNVYKDHNIVIEGQSVCSSKE